MIIVIIMYGSYGSCLYAFADSFYLPYITCRTFKMVYTKATDKITAANNKVENNTYLHLYVLRHGSQDTPCCGMKCDYKG